MFWETWGSGVREASLAGSSAWKHNDADADARNTLLKQEGLQLASRSYLSIKVTGRKWIAISWPWPAQSKQWFPPWFIIRWERNQGRKPLKSHKENLHRSLLRTSFMPPSHFSGTLKLGVDWKACPRLGTSWHKGHSGACSPPISAGSSDFSKRLTPPTTCAVWFHKFTLRSWWTKLEEQSSPKKQQTKTQTELDEVKLCGFSPPNRIGFHTFPAGERAKGKTWEPDGPGYPSSGTSETPWMREVHGPNRCI